MGVRFWVLGVGTDRTDCAAAGITNKGMDFGNMSSLSTDRKLTAAAHSHVIALCFIARSAILRLSIRPCSPLSTDRFRSDLVMGSISFPIHRSCKRRALALEALSQQQPFAFRWRTTRY